MEETKTCIECRHFRKHYVCINGEYKEILQGHCPKPRLRPKKSDAPACRLFEAPPPPEAADARQSKSFIPNS